jgi:hypothetical protein
MVRIFTSARERLEQMRRGQSAGLDRDLTLTEVLSASVLVAWNHPDELRAALAKGSRR